jgi:hypothetical protein
LSSIFLKFRFLSANLHCDIVKFPINDIESKRNYEIINYVINILKSVETIKDGENYYNLETTICLSYYMIGDIDEGLKYYNNNSKLFNTTDFSFIHQIVKKFNENKNTKLEYKMNGSNLVLNFK